MKLLFASIFLSLACASAVLADTITLKDGTTLEGKVTSQTADSYTVLYDRGGGIKDEKTILKSDVVSIDKAGPDDKAFKAIKDFLPTPDRLSPAKYADQIKKVQTFLEVYSTSKHSKEAKGILSKLQAEQKLAAAGGLKLDGRWISANDRAANAYEIDARLHFGDMEDAANAQRYQAALREFEVLQAEFVASEKYPEAVDLAQRVLASYKPQVASMLASVDSQLKEREVQLSRLPATQRAAEEQAYEANIAAYLRRVEAEKKDRSTKWLTLHPHQKAPLQEVQRNIDAAIQLLNNYKPEEQRAAGPIYREAWSAAMAGDKPTADKLISELKSLKVPMRYIDPLVEKLKPVEEPESTTQSPDTTPAPEDTPKEKPEDEPKPEEKPEKPEEKPDAQKTTPKTSADEEEEKGSGTRMLLIGVMALVIIGALLAAFGGKKKN